MKLFYREKIGNKRIIHILGIKFSYKRKNNQVQKLPNYTYDIQNALYRTSYYNAVNKEFVDIAKSNNQEKMFDFLYNTYKDVQELYTDEYFENRYGMQLIYDDILKQPNNKTILDIGCGNCELLKMLDSKGYNVIGCDAGITRVLRNREKYNFPIYFSFAEKLPVKNETIDIIVAQEVLEHVCNLDMALKEMLRILKPKGVGYIQVPYKNMVDCEAHLRIFDENTLSEIISKYFEIISVDIIPYLNNEQPNNIYIRFRK